MAYTTISPEELRRIGERLTAIGERVTACSRQLEQAGIKESLLTFLTIRETRIPELSRWCRDLEGEVEESIEAHHDGRKDQKQVAKEKYIARREKRKKK